MLDLFEKIALGFGGLVALLTLGLYLGLFAWLGIPSGIPSTDSAEFVSAVRERRPTQRPGKTKPGQTAAKPSANEQAIKALLVKQGRAVRGKLDTRDLEISSDLYERVNAEANWMGEIRKARSKRVRTKNGDTRLQILDIEPGSLLEKFGFQDGDTIELIDGEIVHFEESASLKYRALARKLLDTLRTEKPVSVTITRNSRIQHLTFNLSKP